MQPELETRLAFYEDPYLRELEVWVDTVVEDPKLGPGLVLSETLCHPHGGGQKGDRATLRPAPETGLAEVPIVDTRRADGLVLHIVEAPAGVAALRAALEGNKATLALDWDFRFRQMRLHSTAHLLHCFLEQVLGAPLPFPQTSDLQPDFGLNRYEAKELCTEAQFGEALAQLNAYIAAGAPIGTHPAPEPEQAAKGYRFWECGQWRIPCGGTHPADAREIGPVHAELSLKKGRTGMTFRLREGA